jgi:hypothetical protein
MSLGLIHQVPSPLSLGNESLLLDSCLTPITNEIESFVPDEDPRVMGDLPGDKLNHRQSEEWIDLRPR